MTTFNPEDKARAAQAARAAARGEAADGVEYVGFVGCPKLGVLKARMANRGRQMSVLCPRCHEVHATGEAMVRARQPGEAVTLIAEGTPMTVDAPDFGSGPRRVSAAALHAAIPTDREVPAGEVAQALGYADTSGLLDRLRRMNKSAESAVFVLRQEGSRDMMIRRIDPDDGGGP